MKISSTLAQKIVNKLKATLNHQVNFINMDGFIIASSDKNRIDTFHEGATIVIKTKKQLFIKYDGQYEGTKAGINLPIYFENEIIGVIGLTGSHEIEKYAQILKSMTEILIKEAYLNVASFQKRFKQRLLIESLLLHPQNLTDEHLFTFDSQLAYRVVVGNTDELNEQDLSALLSLCESTFIEQQQIYFTINSSYLILLIPTDSVSPDLNLLQEKAFSYHDLNVNFGVGLISTDQNAFKQSFETAKQALKWIQSKNKTQEIAYFENLDLGILLTNIAPSIKQLFLTHVLGEISEKEFKNMRLLLTTFSKHNGSIQKGAEELFIHKNTFQYQLTKLKKITGYDPRNYQDFAILHMALLLHEE